MAISTVYGFKFDNFLTRLSQARTQDATQYIASRISGIVPVDESSGTYVSWPAGTYYKGEARVMPAGARSHGVEFTAGKDTYTVNVYGLHVPVRDQDAKNAERVISLEKAATDIVTNGCLATRDKMVTTAMFKAGVWSTEVQGVASGLGAGEALQWDVDDSTPLDDIAALNDSLEMKSGGGVPGARKVMVIGRKAKTHLQRHPQVLDALKMTIVASGTRAATAPSAVRDSLAALFDVDEVIIPQSMVNTGTVAAPVFVPIWSNHVWIGYVSSSPGMFSASAIQTYSWSSFDMVKDGSGAAMQRIRMDAEHETRIEGVFACAPVVTAPDLGAILVDAVPA